MNSHSLAPANGNGQHTNRLAPTEQTHHVQEDVNSFMKLPPWLQSLRDAMSGAIQADDLTEIMKAQIVKAKKGDAKAAAFVMNQASRLIESEQKKVTVIQNNYYNTPEEQKAETPAKSLPGSKDRLRKMEARAAAGMPLVDPRDRPPSVSDEEEKALRRRQENSEDTF